MVGFNDFARRVNSLMQSDQNAFAARIGTEREAHRIEKIAIAVVADFVVLALRCDNDQRFFRAYGQVQKKGGYSVVNVP